MQNNPYQTFIRLLNKAHFASEEVDQFDLQSNNAKSMAIWRKLLAAQHATFVALVDHVQQHGDEIKELSAGS